MIIRLIRNIRARGVPAAAVLALAVLPTAVASAATPGWDLVWNDEFEGAAVDPAKWTKEVTNNPANNEQQAYIEDQVTVSNGNMVITSENIPTNGKPYRSGRVHSNFTKKYGRWEVRADLPTSKGIWPAIWLLPNTQQYPWPSGGEIDIMENRGQQPHLTSSAYHWGSSWQNHQFRFAEQTMARFGQPVDFHDGFHTYSVEWDATKVRFFVDDVHHWTLYDADTGGFLGDESAPMWTMLNTAVGGDFLNYNGQNGQPDGTTVWPQQFLIDYVRISDRNDDPLRFRNGGFEQNDGSLAGWSVFGNRIDHNNVTVHNEAVAGGDASLKLFGQFRSTNNFSGVSQGITVSPGDPVEASAESFIEAQDALAAGTQVEMKIEFYSDFGGRHGTASLLDEVVTTIADPASMADIWRPHELSAVAPTGAVEARIAFVFVQSPANGGGAIHLDNVSFRNLNLPNVADADGNGVVDGQDMLQWQRNLGTPNPVGPAEGDFNLDGAVDHGDLEIWQEQSGAGTANEQGAAMPIPEPSSTMMALTGLAGLLRLGAVRGERCAEAASLVASAG